MKSSKEIYQMVLGASSEAVLKEAEDLIDENAAHLVWGDVKELHQVISHRRLLIQVKDAG